MSCTNRHTDNEMNRETATTDLRCSMLSLKQMRLVTPGDDESLSEDDEDFMMERREPSDVAPTSDPTR